jgi:dienelactone hydrolase
VNTVVLEHVAYEDRGTALNGWLARPRGRAKAAVLVWPTIANVTPAIERRAMMLADAGYLALIGDFYGEQPASFEASFPLASTLRADVDHFRARLERFPPILVRYDGADLGPARGARGAPCLSRGTDE